MTAAAKISPRRAKALHGFLERVAAYGEIEDPIPKTICAEAAEFVGDVAEAQRKRRGRLERSRPRREAREAKREEKHEHTAMVRMIVFARVASERFGACEWHCEQDATDLHHILGGGRRHAEERPETCAGICRSCHRGFEKADEDTMKRAWVWAHDHGFNEALREIQYRIEKARSVRRAS